MTCTVTNAAVATNISDLFASVTRAMKPVKPSVKATMTMSLVVIDVKKWRVMTGTSINMQAMKLVVRSANVMRAVFDPYNTKSP
jgi:hypothetical protein